MKKGILIMALLILMLFSVSCIYAADVNDTLAAGEDTDVIEDAQSEDISVSDDSQVIGQSNDDETVNDGTAFGVVYEDIDFTDSMGTEVVPVIIFGFINIYKMPTAPSATAISALKMIQFIDDGLVTTTTTVAPTTTTSTSQA